MAQDHGLCRKKKVKTGARAATAGPCCSCQQGSSYNLQRRSWRTWNEQGGGQSKMNGARTLMWAVGMAWQRWQQANKACRTRPLQANTAGGQSDRHRPRRNNSQQLAGLAAKQQPQTTLAGLSPCSAGRWRECGGAGTQEAGSDLLYLSPSHLSPLPVTVSTHSLNLKNPI